MTAGVAGAGIGSLFEARAGTFQHLPSEKPWALPNIDKQVFTRSRMSRRGVELQAAGAGLVGQIGRMGPGQDIAKQAKCNGRALEKMHCDQE